MLILLSCRPIRATVFLTLKCFKCVEKHVVIIGTFCMCVFHKCTWLKWKAVENVVTCTRAHTGTLRLLNKQQQTLWSQSITTLYNQILKLYVYKNKTGRENDPVNEWYYVLNNTKVLLPNLIFKNLILFEEWAHYTCEVERSSTTMYVTLLLRFWALTAILIIRSARLF